MEQVLNNTTKWADLQSRITGQVIDPQHAQYETARRAWNLAVEQRPALIVFADIVDDVVEVVKFANREGLRVAVTATGHGVVRPANGAVLLNLSRMNRVQVDPASRTARIEGGAKWGPVLQETQAYGLAPLLGSSPDVGAVGYTLGGGIGWLARKYGLSADSVLSFDVVTSDGCAMRASTEENSELFWGLRGAGGSLAIVTAMVVRLYEVKTVYAGNLFYSAEQALEVVTHYRDWIADAPDALTSSIVLMNFPPMPQIPEFLRGQSFAIVRGCYAGTAEEGQRMLRHWREWQAPLIDDFKEIPFAEVATISNDPVDPLPGLSSGTLLRKLSDEAIETLIEFGVSRNGSSPLTVTEVRHAGGAIARVDPSCAAYGNREAQHIMQLIAMTPTPEIRKAVQDYVEAFKRALQPHQTGGAYLNFLEGKEARERIREGYSPEAFLRLRQLKTRLDPHNRLAYSANILPESGTA